MVMPCSRSARRPSVEQREVDVAEALVRLTRASTASSWSARTDFESCSSRPTSVDLPSSTQPGAWRAGAARCCLWSGHQKYPSFLRSSMAASVSRSSARVAPRSVMRVTATSTMHRRDVGGVGLDGAGAGHVADRAVAHLHVSDELVAARLGVRADREPHAVALEDLAVVREVDRRQLDVLALRCSATRRARSSCRSGTRARARRRAGRCTGPTARGAGYAGPTGRTRRAG